jgi:hypothetical protein
MENILTENVLSKLGSLLPSLLEYNKISLESNVDIGEIFKFKYLIDEQSLDIGHMALIFVNNKPRIYAIIKNNDVSEIAISKIVTPLYEKILNLDDKYEDLADEDFEIIFDIDSKEYTLHFIPENQFIKIK